MTDVADVKFLTPEKLRIKYPKRDGAPRRDFVSKKTSIGTH